MRAASVLCFVGVCCGMAMAQPRQLGYYRQPTIHGDTIVFVAEGDLWKTTVEGGRASRLTSHPANEGSPRLSPDGTRVAFTGQYEGPTEVYVMPLTGGTPMRLTYDAERAAVAGWDGPRVLATTNRFATLPATQMTVIDPANGERTLIELAQASDGCYDNQHRLFFTRLPFQGSQTKRYQGGTAQNIWRWDGGDKEAVPLTGDFAGTSATPMCWQGRVYFISDRGGTMELWSMDAEGKGLKQHTRPDRPAGEPSLLGFDVKTPALSEGRVVYQRGADLWIHDIAKGSDRALAITLDSDFDQTRDNWIKKPMDYLSAAHLSPDGDRVALTARGQVFVAPKTQGRLVEASRKDGVRYREARFMPDGASLLTLSDESGEVEFWKLPPNGVGKPSQITDDAKVLRWEGVPSPDGKWLAHYDKNQKLWLLNVETKAQKQVAANPFDEFQDVRWAPDSRWFTYTTNAGNLNRQVMVYGVEDGSITPVTTDRFNSYDCVWSVDGKFLYLLSDRSLKTAGSPWGPMAPEPFFDNKTKVYQVALKQGVRSPFAPADELHTQADKKKEEARKKDDDKKKARDKKRDDKLEPAEPGDKPEKKPDQPDTEAKPADADSADADAGEGGKKPPKVKPVEIDLEGLADRITEVPVAPGNYYNLSCNDKRLYFMNRDGEKQPDLCFVEIAPKDVELKTLLRDINSYELSMDGKSILIHKRDALHIIEASVGANATLDDKNAVKLSGWTFPIIPREEWRQMFVEAWRLERDYFYDTGMHGLDWKAMLARYMPLVDRVSTREELSDLIAQMVGELSALHIFVRGGDVRQGTDQITPASLGGLLTRDEAAGGYRVERIYRCDPDTPERRSPLLAPGVDMSEGDIILDVNGRSALSVPDIAMLLRNQAGKQVLLHIRPQGGGNAAKDGEPPVDAEQPPNRADDPILEAPTPRDSQPDDGTRNVVITPISAASESDLRYHDWEHGRRIAVEAAGEGRIGYVHLRAMGAANMAEFVQGFYPVFNREGLIIDVRRNRGGNIDSWILSRLLRKAWFFWQPRVGEPYWNMQYAFRGHVAVLCDESTASDGEAFAEGIKRLKIGTVIGTRTWGGEIWLSSSNVLVDGGIATAAENGVFGPEGDWLIEGHGVDPDIVVDNLPHATFKGEDAQLTAAIRHLQRKMREEPIEPPKAPAHPNKAWKPSRMRAGEAVPATEK